MGMFDTITFKCPNCNTDLDAQSKSGDCLLNTYERHSVPLDVSFDANRHAPFKCDCGCEYIFYRDPVPLPPEKVWLSLREIKTNTIIK